MNTGKIITKCFLILSPDLYGKFFIAGMMISNVVYVSEVSHKQYRSIFLSLLGFYFSLGILLTTVLQAFLTWRQSALFNFAFFIVTSFLVAIFTPESPLWLANFRSDWKGAKRSLRRLIANDQVNVFVKLIFNQLQETRLQIVNYRKQHLKLLLLQMAGSQAKVLPNCRNSNMISVIRNSMIE